MYTHAHSKAMTRNNRNVWSILPHRMQHGTVTQWTPAKQAHSENPQVFSTDLVHICELLLPQTIIRIALVWFSYNCDTTQSWPCFVMQVNEFTYQKFPSIGRCQKSACKNECAWTRKILWKKLSHVCCPWQSSASGTARNAPTVSSATLHMVTKTTYLWIVQKHFLEREVHLPKMQLIRTILLTRRVHYQ